MTVSALALVLAAAFVHATWNLLAKRAGDGGTTFVWLFASLSALFYAPLAVAVLLVERPRIGLAELSFMLGSGVLHLGYFLLLQRGYGVGDLSVVYPLARGTGPLLATAAAIVFFKERPSAVALCGMLMIMSGVFGLTRGQGRTEVDSRSIGAGVIYGLLTGGFIAAYTLWDKHAVGVLLVPPLLFDWAVNLVRAVMLTPAAWWGRDKVSAVWCAHKHEAVGVALLSPLSYILVLTALSFTPVSYVAPLRETSILIATAMGARLLAEGDIKRRLPAAGAMVAGVVALAIG